MNACETAAGLLPDYLDDALRAPERASDLFWLNQHLAECAECAGMAQLWQKLGNLPAAPASPLARERFLGMLGAYQHGMQAHAPAPAPRRAWFAPLALRPGFALAAAALLVAAGLGLGWVTRGVMNNGSGAPNSSQQVADLEQEVRTTRQLVVLSMLQQQSASDRLQGVSYSTSLASSDPQVVDALMHSLEFDNSPDVRLAAMDALVRHAAQPEIQKGLVEAFRFQKSPLVQIALVDTFVETRDRGARSLLEQVSKDANYSPEVRQRAAWGLQQPTWN
ncbi:MAG TPA: hypothetical protein VN690_13175 [Terriglobales bacterium]|nr:hypothetical protein [Terriglobales bacterium]